MKTTTGIEFDAQVHIRPPDWTNPGAWVNFWMKDTEAYEDYRPAQVGGLLTPDEARELAAELLRVADEVEREGR